MKALDLLNQITVQLLYTAITLFVTPAAFANSGPALNWVQPQTPAPVTGQLGQSKLWVSLDAMPILDFKRYIESQDINKRQKLKEGPRTGGGGSSCAIGIVRNTEALIETLNEMPSLFLKPELESIKNKSSHALYYKAKELTLDGESKDAINYPYYRAIYVTENFCEKLESIVSGATMALILHEILGLAKIDDAHYQRTQEFLKAYYDEDKRIREGSSAFGSFAGDVPVEAVRNVKKITVKQAVCARQAATYAKAMTLVLGGKQTKIFSIESSEQYAPASDAFNKVESYYFDQDVKLSLDMHVTEDKECLFLSLQQVRE